MIKHLTFIAAMVAGTAWAEPQEIMVQAQAETPGTKGDADDPAIWVHPTDPEQSLVLGTDKKAGLAVFNLRGEEVAFFADGDMNNVDVRAMGDRWLAGASERREEVMAFYWITAEGEVSRAGVLPAAPEGADADDVYGFAMQSYGNKVYALANYKSGEIFQWEITANGDELSSTLARTLKVETQPEGMVSDDREGYIYVGEEDVAIWRFPGDPTAAPVATKIDSIGSDCLPVDDIEGLAIYDGETRYLVASAQGIDRFAIYPLDAKPECVALVGVNSGEYDGVNETDGLAVTSAPLGADYPQGMMVVMDDKNSGFTNNFKFVSWADVAKQLTQ